MKGEGIKTEKKTVVEELYDIDKEVNERGELMLMSEFCYRAIYKIAEIIDERDKAGDEKKNKND